MKVANTQQKSIRNTSINDLLSLTTPEDASHSPNFDVALIS